MIKSVAVMAVLATLAAGAPAAARPLDEVKKSGVLEVFVYADFAPYSFDDHGTLKGIDVDVGEALASALGVKVDYMVRPAGEDVDADLRFDLVSGTHISGRLADVMLHVPADPAFVIRHDRAAICCAWLEESLGVLYDKKKIPSVESFDRLADTPVAVEGDTISAYFVTTALNGQLQKKLIRGRSFDEAAESFLSGRASALVAPLGQLQWVARQTHRPTAIATPPMPGLLRHSWPIGIAVRGNSRDLGEALGKALLALQSSGRLAQICAKYGTDCRTPAYKLKYGIRD